jgi:hypothetical protein
MTNATMTEIAALKTRVAELEAALILAHGCLDSHTTFEAWGIIEKALPASVQAEIAANDWGGDGYVEPVEVPASFPVRSAAINLACANDMLSSLRSPSVA